MFRKTVFSLSILSFTISTVILMSNFASQAQQQNNTQPKELGKVRFHRGYDSSLVLAQKEKKPVFLLFDEVPG